MRVAIVNLTSGGLSGGYKKYLERMLPLLRESPAVTRLDVLSPSGLDVPPSTENYWSWPSDDGMTGYRALKRELARREPDVVFVPTARLVKTQHPSVVMVRNMEPLIAPFAGNSPRDGLRNIGRRLAARASCHRGTRVIAVSPFVRDFVVNRWHVSAGKVGIVPHGVERPLSKESWIRPSAVTLAADRPMLFTAGSIRPARGLEDVFGALRYLEHAGLRPTLVIAGSVSGDGVLYQRRLQRDLEASGQRARVIWAGALSEREMAWCYGNCDAFAMTSRVEACPNTALEALAYGSACVATSRRPMPETFGDAARYYEAGDSRMLGQELESLLRLPAAEKTRLAARATARAAHFTWEKTVRETVEQLQLAAERRDG